jgi:hypothetical protein
MVKSLLPYREGCKDLGEESWQNWAVYEAPIDPSVLDSSAWYVGYAGPGRQFSRRPVIRRWGKRVLIKQICGLDV